MTYDVVVIGAGQAGLAMGYYLKDIEVSYLLLDQSSAVGEVWRKRYDSLTLFTPRAYSSLPGMKLDGNESIYPTKDEIANYLSEYADEFSLNLQLNTQVFELSKANDIFKLSTNQGELLASNVVVATGPFQTPFVPEFHKHLTKNVVQLHSSQYKNPEQLREGPVVVVGSGNSGAQIAVELSEDREVYLSSGHQLKFLPLNIGSKSIFWYFDKLGVYRANRHSKIGKFIKNKPDPIFGFELKNRVKKGDIQLKPRTISVKDDVFTFEDKSQQIVENVIWATGFKPDYSWINLPLDFDKTGLPIHQRGMTEMNGLYFLGLPWQNNRGSALIQGVGNDASFIKQQIMRRLKKA